MTGHGGDPKTRGRLEWQTKLHGDFDRSQLNVWMIVSHHFIIYRFVADETGKKQTYKALYKDELLMAWFDFHGNHVSIRWCLLERFPKPLNSPDVHRTSVKGLPLKIGKGCQRWYKCYNDIVWIHTPPPSNSSKYRFSSGFLTNVILLVTASEWRVNPKVLSKAKGPIWNKKNKYFQLPGPTTWNH